MMTRPYAEECVPTATIEEYLDRLEEVIECAPTMPFTGKCVLDRKEVTGLISAMRSSLASAGAQAYTKPFSQVRTGSFPALSPEKAGTTVAQESFPDAPFDNQPALKGKAQEELVQREVMDAQAEAVRILDDAKAEAAKIRQGADEYAENTLASVEQNALGAARSARKGLEVLQRRRASNG